MSLDWGIEKCKDWKELKSDKEWPITEAVIFECMAVGMNGITEKNWETFYQRSVMFRRVIAATEFEPDDIKRRIGLNTNVSTESQATWLKRLWKEHESRTRRRVKWKAEEK